MKTMSEEMMARIYGSMLEHRDDDNIEQCLAFNATDFIFHDAPTAASQMPDYETLDFEN